MATLLILVLAAVAIAADGLDDLVRQVEGDGPVRDRVRAIRKVGTLAVGDAAARSALLAAAESTSLPPEVRLEAVAQLVRRKHEQSRAARAAASLLAHDDAAVRAEAAERLSRLGPHAAAEVNALLSATDDDDDTVRAMAVMALGELKLPEGRALLKVSLRLKFLAIDADQPEDVRRFADEALDRLGVGPDPVPTESTEESTEESDDDAPETRWETMRREGRELVERGRLDEGVMLLDRARAECLRTDEEWKVINILIDLAGAQHRMERWDDCETTRREALRLAEKHYGARHERTAWGLNNLADVLAKRGRLAEAEGLSRHALLLMEELGIHETPRAALAIHNLGGICEDQGLYDEAERLLRRALETWRTAHGEEHEDVARAYNSLANLYRSQKQYDKAVEYYGKARDNWSQSKGPEHLYTQYAYYNIGLTENGRGRYREAERVLRKCLGITERTLGKRSVMYVDTLDQYTTALRGLGRDAEADTLDEEESRLRDSLR